MSTSPQKPLLNKSWISTVVNTCMILTGIVMLLLLLGCIGFYIFGIYLPQTQAQAELQANKAKWTAKGTSTYSITIQMGGGLSGTARNTLYIRDSALITQSGFHCMQYCELDQFSSDR